MNPTPPPVGGPVAPPRTRFSRAALERVILFAVLAGSFWAIWYSIGRLRTLHTHTRQLDQQIARLTAEIDLMKAQWSGVRTQEIASRFEKVPDSLFVGESSIAAWTEELQKEAVPLGLDTQFRLVNTVTETNGLQSVTRIKGVIDIQQSPGTRSPRPLFHRLIDWSRQLATQPRRIDLLEFRAVGNGSGGGQASATVELWTQDKGTTPPADATPAAPEAPTPDVAAATQPSTPSLP